MRPLHPIIRKSLSFRHAVLADTCVIASLASLAPLASLLSTTTYTLYGLANTRLLTSADISSASLQRRLRRLRRCSPRPRTRCTGSTTTRLVTAADISSASLQRPLRRIALRSSVVRLRVVSLPAPSSLAARVSASLERPSPVDSGRRGSLSSIVFTRSVHGFTHSLV